MDYVDDDAMFMFTAGQATRMNAALNGPRKLLFQAVPKFPGNLGPSKTKKPAVKKVQVELRDRFKHPDLKADGVYGAHDRGDRRAFQEKRKDEPWRLPVNGKVGKKTWIALSPGLEPDRHRPVGGLAPPVGVAHGDRERRLDALAVVALERLLGLARELDRQALELPAARERPPAATRRCAAS